MEIHLRTNPNASVEVAFEKAFAAFAQVADQLSADDLTGDVAQLNRGAGGHWITVDAETVQALLRARSLAAETGGAYDPTVLPLQRIWGLKSAEPRSPNRAQLAYALSLVDWAKLAVDPTYARARLLERGMEIELGDFRLGYAADRALDTLRRSEVNAACVQLERGATCYGGTSRAPWSLSFLDPDDSTVVLAELDLTSGGSWLLVPRVGLFADRSSSEPKLEGELHARFIDPRTGQPNDELYSVITAAHNAALAAGYAEALLAMGEGAQMFVAGRRRLEAMLVSNLNQPWISDGFPARGREERFDQ